MSVDAHLEVDTGKHLDLSNDFGASKAIATFIEVISVYCDSDKYRDLDGLKEIYEWFLEITSNMSEDLCVLDRIFYGFWEYAETDYDRYLLELKENDLSSVVLSKEEFIGRCKEFDNKWIDVDVLKVVIDDLVSVLKAIKPPEMWWYAEKDTLIDFQSLSDALLRVSKRGYQRVRIYCQ
jgi:hypothetical protein